VKVRIVITGARRVGKSRLAELFRVMCESLLHIDDVAIHEVQAGDFEALARAVRSVEELSK
jgi:dephospho-CoA kinase